MPKPNGWGFGPTLNDWRITMDTKIVSMIDKRGNVQNMKLDNVQNTNLVNLQSISFKKI